MTEQALATVEAGRPQLEIVPVSSGAIMQGIMQAVERGADPEKLQQMYNLAVQVSDREARAEFSRSMAAFQEACPFVGKNASADFESKKAGGGRVKYKWASLDHIVDTLRTILPQFGFSYSWDVDASSGSMVKITCTVEHLNGVKRTSSIVLPTDATTSAMSPQQRFASAITFGKRLTLANAFGLTEKLDDAGADDKTPPPEMLSTTQQEEINDMLIAMDDAKLWHPKPLRAGGPIGRASFLEIYAGSVDGKLSDIPAAKFHEASERLRRALERGKVQ